MQNSLDKQREVVTPEQVQLEFKTAGIGSRAAAHLIDAVLLSLGILLIIAAMIGFGVLLRDRFVLASVQDYGLTLFLVLLVLLCAGYLVGTEYLMNGQTPGKRLTGLRVLMNNGQRVTLLSVFIRNAFRLIDMLPASYFLGAAVMMFSSQDKRIGDMAAGTLVVVEQRREHLRRRRKLDKLIGAYKPPIPAMELSPAERGRIQLEDWRLLNAWTEGLLSGMLPARRVELGRPIAAHLAARLGHPAESAAEPERYLLSLYSALREEWEV